MSGPNHVVVLIAAAALVVGCGGSAAPPKVKVKVRGTPPDATVIVDDQPVGPLRVVEKYGLALPKGRHRVTVERAGYFPYDRAIDATGEPVMLEVTLQKIPE